VVTGTAISLASTGLTITQSSSPITTVTDSGSPITINWATANNQIVQLAGSHTIQFSNITAGQTVRLLVQQAGSGTFTPTFATSGVTYDWCGTPGYVAPAMPATASAYLLVSFYAVTSTLLLCSSGGGNAA
jgi:hypothetical protein